jgi:hypothetical protein
MLAANQRAVDRAGADDGGRRKNDVVILMSPLNASGPALGTARHLRRLPLRQIRRATSSLPGSARFEGGSHINSRWRIDRGH